MALDFIPVVGDVKGVVEGIIGRDLITGRELSAPERMLGMLGLSELRNLRHLRHLDDLGDVARATDNMRQYRALGEHWQRRVTLRPEPGLGHNGPPVRIKQNTAGEVPTSAKSKVSGGHSYSHVNAEPGAHATQAKGPDDWGVSTAQVERYRMNPDGTIKTDASGNPLKPLSDEKSMWPPNYSESKINSDIADAYADAQRKGSVTIQPNGVERWTGLTPDGVKVGGYNDPAKGLSGYPVRADDPLQLTPGQAGRLVQDVLEPGSAGGDPGSSSPLPDGTW